MSSSEKLIFLQFQGYFQNNKKHKTSDLTISYFLVILHLEKYITVYRLNVNSKQFFTKKSGIEFEFKKI